MGEDIQRFGPIQVSKWDDVESFIAMIMEAYIPIAREYNSLLAQGGASLVFAEPDEARLGLVRFIEQIEEPLNKLLEIFESIEKK